MKIILTLCIALAAISNSFAQCCSVGTPIGGTTSVGTVPIYNLRWTSFFRASVADEYNKDGKNLGQGLVRVAKYDYIGTSFAYGITGDLTAEAELGYFVSKSQKYANDFLEGKGFSSMILSAKYNVLHSMDSKFEMTLGAGARIPLSVDPLYVNGVALQQDIQPSPGAYGVVASLFARKWFKDSDINLFLIHRSEFSGMNNYQSPATAYRLGNTYLTSVFASKKIYDKLSAVLQLRNEYHDKDNKTGIGIVPNSGNILFLVSPQLNYAWNTWNFSLLYDYPFYKYYNGTQLSNSYSLTFNISGLFDLDEMIFGG